MEIAGYQSDLHFSDIHITENYPIVYSLGGFGVTTSKTPDAYLMSLSPKLSQPYPIGLPLQVRFHTTNLGAATLNVDGMGAMPIQKFGRIAKEDLQAKDIVPERHYIVLFDGVCFQIVNSIPIKPLPPPPLCNTQTILCLKKDQLSKGIYLTPEGNRYVAMNKNLIMGWSLRVQRTGGAGILENARLKLPKPVLGFNITSLYSTVFSKEGQPFLCVLSKEGILTITGELQSDKDAIILNFNPYLAQYPLVYDNTVL